MNVLRHIDRVVQCQPDGVGLYYGYRVVDCVYHGVCYHRGVMYSHIGGVVDYNGVVNKPAEVSRECGVRCYRQRAGIVSVAVAPVVEEIPFVGDGCKGGFGIVTGGLYNIQTSVVTLTNADRVCYYWIIGEATP